MAVQSNDTIERYTIAGQGPYAFGFRIFAETEVTVRAIDSSTGVPTTLSLNSQYTVDGVDDEGGGEITLSSAVATTYSGDTLDIRSNTTVEQPTKLAYGGAYRGQDIEKALDRLTRQAQDLKRQLRASLRLPDYLDSDFSLDPIANWFNRYVYVNEDGVPEPAAALNTTTLTQSVIANLLAPQTSDESAAGITPTSTIYSPGDARRYGFSESATASQNATAITNAIASLPQFAGYPCGLVLLPAGEFDVSAFTVPRYVRVQGASQFGTTLRYAGTSYCVTIGDDIDSLSYGCALTDLSIRLDHKDGKAIKTLCTNGAQIARLYIEGLIVASRSTIGIAVDGGNASSFFNKIDSVICNHIETGFRLLTTGLQRSTNTTFMNCSSLGDVATHGSASIGLKVDASQGDGSVWVGGNFESCGTAIQLANGALCGSIHGARFEGNTVDIEAVNGAYSWSFFGIQTETEELITDPGDVLRFFGCTTLGGTQWKRVNLGASNSVRRRILQGTGSFSASGSATVTIGETLQDTTYNVIIIDNSGATSGLRFRHNKASNTTTTFSVTADTSNSNSFSWILIQ